jgi:hypothetical protein
MAIKRKKKKKKTKREVTHAYSLHISKQRNFKFTIVFVSFIYKSNGKIKNEMCSLKNKDLKV